MEPSHTLTALHSLAHILAITYTCGPWLVLAALAARFFAPVWKGGR